MTPSFESNLSKAAGGLANTDRHLIWHSELGVSVLSVGFVLRCPLRTVLLTVVFTLDGARYLYLPEKQQEDFL